MTTVAPAQGLRVAIGRVARRMRQLYAAYDATGPTFTEVAVLSHLAREGPSTVTELAGRERVTSQAITMVLGELEAGGLITRAPDPADRRRRVVTITATGRGLLADRENAVVERLIAALDAHFTEAERARLDRAVPLLDRLADTL